MSETLHLVKVPLLADKLVGVARKRRLPLRDLDEGYLGHCLLRELWQERAPAPFVLKPSGRTLEVWGYSNTSAGALIEHARGFGDPTLLSVVSDLSAISSKPMPCFEKGHRVGFLLRACPVVRLAGPKNGYRDGVEIDAFLARCFAVGKTITVSREGVYRDWLQKRLGQEDVSGAAVEHIRVAAMSRERLARCTHGQERRVGRLQRPDVRFEGNLVVSDGQRLLLFLARGVGRHRAFGFGALILVPAGTSYGA